MSDDMDDLKHDYRQIKAPAHLGTRIRANVEDRPVRSHAWLPATATIMIAVAAIWILPFAWQQQAGKPATPTKPSLSALAALKPTKPAVAAPSLSRIQSVSVPRMPTKPNLAPSKPQTNIKFENSDLQEKDHAHI